MRTLYKIHKWVGLALALLLIMQTLSGVAIVYRQELNAFLHPGAFQAPSSTSRSLDAVVASVDQHFADHRLERLVAPVGENGVFVAWLRSAEGALHLATFAPADAGVLSFGPLWSYPVELSFHWHYSLLAGTWGTVLIGVMGLLALAMAVTGIILWWPKGKLTNGFKIKTHISRGRTILDLHRVPAVYLTPIVILILLTGTGLAFKAEVKSALAVFLPAQSFPSLAVPPDDGSALRSPDGLWVETARRHPERPLRDVRFVGPEGRVIGFILRVPDGAHARLVDQVWLDRQGGGVIAEVLSADAAAANRLSDWMLPLHTGEWGGAVGRVITLLAGLVLLGTVITGVWLWLDRRRMRQATKKKATRPVTQAASSR